MTASFASQEWADTFATHLNDDARVRTDSVTWVFGPILLVVDGDESLGLESTGIRIDLHEGEVRGVTLVDAADAVRNPTALGGSLARWKAVFGGSLSVVDGVREAKIRLRGDLPTLTRHSGLFDGIARAAASVETAWQDEVPAEAAAPAAG
ncbi:MAG: Fis family transcriptional regulator [Thermoleophilia bacterium]|nr:Fis family transcriptional regulator [Thermoleophilia bacterium]